MLLADSMKDGRYNNNFIRNTLLTMRSTKCNAEKDQETPAIEVLPGSFGKNFSENYPKMLLLRAVQCVISEYRLEMRKLVKNPTSISHDQKLIS